VNWSSRRCSPSSTATSTATWPRARQGKTDCKTGDNDVTPSSTPAAVAGYPAVTEPAGFVGELPVGISFMAGQWTDARVLASAADFERVVQARKPPRYLKTVG
jgi:amidase